MPRVWVWTGHMWSERIQFALEHYGDRITDVSIFGWSVSATGDLTETFDPNLLDHYRQQWPHIRFWGCFRNMDDPDDGPRAIFDALRDSAAARRNLADEVEAMFDTYPWLHGVDIDLESGGDDRPEESELIFQHVADRAHSLGRQVGAALPPLTATGSVGGENWVRYRQLGEMLDVVEIMSYDFSWSGSAPGPISPGFWMEEVYSWVASQVDPAKVYMGVPLYAYFWRIHDYPSNLGQTWRGLSGTYYSFMQQFNGITPWYSDDQHPDIAWVAYRDPSSRSLWGFLHAYDWMEPSSYAEAFGTVTDTYQGREYLTRYGLPAGSPQWSVTDNSAGEARVEYPIVAEPAIDIHGDQVEPYNGFTLTAEVLKRDPVAATIIDDYATSDQQLDAIYTQPDGAWETFEVTDAYRQYRGSGTLEFNNGFGDQALYVMGRFQFAAPGTMAVYSRGITAELRDDGRLRLLRGSTVLDTTWVPARATGAAPQSAQAVLALRVRDGSARVYLSAAETSIPLVLEAETTPPGGPTGYDAGTEVWLDHIYLGDGWWYQPREAFEVTIGGETELMGRIDREGVEWDDSNRFRPTSDVDEPDTREEATALDWVYEHWQGIPITAGEETAMRVTPVDHDTWLGRLIIFDREVGIIAYCNDGQAVAHWRARADHDWGLQGIALWSLGQEDVRLWDTLEGGELSGATKRLEE
ncbi:hypothetical protein I2485_06875 [Nesterenkonia sp. E16_7]|uniref:glycosyl hydrolase family 18 protein n=1 Tax=unclassified Nesterenkonia TaxID=2629769 RepID=UPI001A926702|nr:MULTISPECIES: glycosyl hydrolase family 18 protein [unclassified Nesterenkonia]MBO0596598.1 hypothetical protein [Nesterenkonia sp. E16_10]MBO0598375.1 hypothetical protein [Nesterenkonia sp. E16_7]